MERSALHRKLKLLGMARPATRKNDEGLDMIRVRNCTK